MLYVGSAWAIIRYEGEIGYIKRDRITNVTAVDPVNTCPYGVQKCTYIARTAVTCPVYKSMSTSDESWVTLNPGTLVGLWVIQDGWAVVPYWRTYGYIPLETLTELIPVSPTDTPLDDDTPIAAYTSYYDMAQNDVNKSRIVNIRVACERLTRVMQPGEELDFNDDVGPYRKRPGLSARMGADGRHQRAGLWRRHLPGILHAVQRPAQRPRWRFSSAVPTDLPGQNTCPTAWMPRWAMTA